MTARPQEPRPSKDACLVVAISSRALFDLDESHRVFELGGEDAYSRHQIEKEDEPLAPGVVFPLARKLLALNGATPRVEVILISRNSADTGLRVFNSIRHHGLDITRAAFTRGESPYRYIGAFDAHLFLSADAGDVRKALEAGIAAASILPSAAGTNSDGQLRIAFDGDAVLFSDESERIYAADGLDAFNRNEAEAKDWPLSGGPFRPFLTALHEIQSGYPANASPIRTALVTARGAPAHERVIPYPAQLGHPHRRSAFPGRPRQRRISQGLRRRHLLRRPDAALRIGGEPCGGGACAVWDQERHLN